MSAPVVDPIEQLQRDMAARADAEFPYYTVYIDQPRSDAEATLIFDGINKSLAGTTTKNGKAGIALLVGMAEGEIPHQDSSGPQLRLLPAIRVIENPLINMGAQGTGDSAMFVVLELLQLFHEYTDGQTQSSMLGSKTPYRSLPEYLKDDQIAYDVFFERALPIASPAKCAAPKISGTVDAVTLTCSTPGAAIWYTFDGSYPANAPGSAQVYTAVLYVNPFSVEPGTLVRAVATLAGKQASNLAAKTIN